MAKIWHFHYECGQKYKLDTPLAAGEPCPKCDKPYAKRVQSTCHGCNTEYYTDRSHSEGDKFSCPINGEPVVVESSRIIGTPIVQPDIPVRDANLFSWIKPIATLVGILLM